MNHNCGDWPKTVDQTIHQKADQRGLKLETIEGMIQYPAYRRHHPELAQDQPSSAAA